MCFTKSNPYQIEQPYIDYCCSSIRNTHPRDVMKNFVVISDFEQTTYFHPMTFASQASTMLDNIHTYDISMKSHEGKSKSCEKSGL